MYYCGLDLKVIADYVIFIRKPAYLERVEYWQQHGWHHLLIGIAKALCKEGKRTILSKQIVLRFWPVFDISSFNIYIHNFKIN